MKYLLEYGSNFFPTDSLLLEGGSYGHISHPYEDYNLTFGDLLNLIEKSLDGTLDLDDHITEKIDGIAISFSSVNGNIVFARNKTHLKEFGKYALAVEDMEKYFKANRVKDVFRNAAIQLRTIFSSMNSKLTQKLFQDGKYFLNVEIVFPDYNNVIEYGNPFIILHNLMFVDETGTQKGYTNVPVELKKKIDEVNKTLKLDFEMKFPEFIKIKQHPNLEDKLSKYKGIVSKLLKNEGLKVTNTIGDYLHKKMTSYLQTEFFTESVLDSVIEKLANRIVYGDKSYNARIIRQDLDNADQFLAAENNELKQKIKEYLTEIRFIVVSLGIDVLNNAVGLIPLDKEKNREKISKRISYALSRAEVLNKKEKIEVITKIVDEIKQAGGLDTLIPSEGIVFFYNGKQYKLTGQFANINKILGMFIYND